MPLEENLALLAIDWFTSVRVRGDPLVKPAEFAVFDSEKAFPVIRSKLGVC